MKFSSLLWLVLCSGAAQAATLPSSVIKELRQQQIPEQALAVHAFMIDQPEHQLSIQPDRAMQPASTMKLLTSIVALSQLGPDYRAKVELRAAEPVTATMQKPLLLKGYGSADFDLAALWRLLQQAYQQGIRHIPALVIDRSWIAGSRPDLSAPYFDESPKAYYNLIPDAIFLERSMSDLSFSSDQHQLTLSQSPWPAVPVHNQIELTDQVCEQWDSEQVSWQLQRLPQGFQLQLAGTFPRHCQQTDSMQLWDRADYSRLAIQQLWQQISGQQQLKVLELSQLPDIPALTLEQLQGDSAVVLAQHHSRTLAEQLREINKNSDNAMTRLLFLHLSGSSGASPAQASASVINWFEQQHIDTTGLVLDNGSGLSRTERITARQMTSLLQFAMQSPYAPELIASLPLAGTDGTLKRRFVNSPLQGKARLKTGTLRNAVALAGIIEDHQKRRWIVSAMLNDASASAKGRPVLDALMLAIYNAQLH